MRLYEFASMGSTASGAIATVATPLNKKPIKRVQEDSYEEPRRGDDVTFNDEGASHGRVIKNNKDGTYKIRWSTTKTTKDHPPEEFTIIHRRKRMSENEDAANDKEAALAQFQKTKSREDAKLAKQAGASADEVRGAFLKRHNI